MITGRDSTRHEQRHGRPSKLTLLKQLIATDPDVRARLRARAKELRAAEVKERMQAAGMALNLASRGFRRPIDVDLDEEIVGLPPLRD